MMSGTIPKTRTLVADLMKKVMPEGCTVTDGCATAALAPVAATTEPIKNIKCVTYSRGADGFMAYADGGLRLGSGAGTTLFEVSKRESENAFVIDYRDSERAQGVLVCDGYSIYFYNGLTFMPTGSIGAKLSCGVMRCGRLFGGDGDEGDKLCWSGEEGIEDWELGISGAGWAYLPPAGGKIQHVFNFEDRLIVFREFAITRMKVYGTPENFAIESEIYLPKILKNTPAVAGGGIMFMTVCGAYRYAGGKAERVEGLLTDDAQDAVYAASHDGRNYFVCATSSYLKRKVVYCHDCGKKSAYVLDIPATAVAGGEDMIAYCDDKTYRLRQGDKCLLRFARLDFGCTQRKLLNTIEVDCDGECEIEVSNGALTRQISGTCGVFKVGMRGNYFYITLKSGARVRSCIATGEVEDGI